MTKQASVLDKIFIVFCPWDLYINYNYLYCNFNLYPICFVTLYLYLIYIIILDLNFKL